MDTHERPDFKQISAKLRELQGTAFASIKADAFSTLQQSWKEEVRLKFEQFKKKEEVCVIQKECVFTHICVYKDYHCFNDT